MTTKLWNAQIIWMIFLKILKNTTQIRNPKLLIAFDGMIADILSNTKRNSIVTESFIIDGKLNTFLVFITQLYLTVPKI